MKHRMNEKTKDSRRLDKQSMVVSAIVTCASLAVIGILFASLYQTIADGTNRGSYSYETTVADYVDTETVE